MKTAILSGSPKQKNSCSEMLAQQVFLDEAERGQLFHCMNMQDEQAFQQLSAYDTILLTFPLYFDALPSHLLQFLQAWEAYIQNHPTSLQLYVIVNCGFFEGIQNQLAMRILENWCLRTKVSFQGGIGIGAGPMLYEMASMPWNHGPKKPVYQAMLKLKHAMKQGLPFETCYVQPRFPRRLYIAMAHHSWNKQLAQNGYRAKKIYPKQ